MTAPHCATLAALAVYAVMAVPTSLAAQTRTREAWIAVKTSGFAVPAGESATALLVELNPLLASPDPVLRDDVAFSAAERWIVRDKVVAPDGLRTLISLWSANLDDGLGASGDDRVFTRSFSALSLSLIAAREVATPFLTADEAQRLFERLLDAVRAKIEASDVVFAWGENGRLALALHSAARRPDADVTAVERWTSQWPSDHAALWANGPLVNPVRFARVENATQVLRSLHAALAMEQSPTAQGESVRRATLAALARMR